MAVLYVVCIKLRTKTLAISITRTTRAASLILAPVVARITVSARNLSLIASSCRQKIRTRFGGCPGPALTGCWRRARICPSGILCLLEIRIPSMPQGSRQKGRRSQKMTKRTGPCFANCRKNVRSPRSFQPVFCRPWAIPLIDASKASNNP
jgi:hypothetical protein